jgi:hypothetical protein
VLFRSGNELIPQHHHLLREQIIGFGAVPDLVRERLFMSQDWLGLVEVGRCLD